MNGIEQQAMPMQDLSYLHVQGIHSVKKYITIISMIYTAYRYINFKRNDKCMTTAFM